MYIFIEAINMHLEERHSENQLRFEKSSISRFHGFSTQPGDRPLGWLTDPLNGAS